ncbi:MAG: hypothetical protein ACRBBN_04070 [Methyloligellaceae bacterium]
MHLIVAIGKGILNVVLSVIIGGIAVVYCDTYYPDVMDSIQSVSTILKSILGFVGIIPSQPNTLQSLLLDDNQMAFIAFVIAARVILAILSTIYSAIFGGEKVPYANYNSRPQQQQTHTPPQNPNGYRQQQTYRQPPPQNRQPYSNNYR